MKDKGKKMNKVKNIQPNGIFSKSKNHSVKNQNGNILLNERMGTRNCNDLSEKIIPNRDRFDLQQFIKFMKEVKANTIFSIYYNEKEKDCVEITLHDSRKVFGRKLNINRKELDGNYMTQITVVL